MMRRLRNLGATMVAVLAIGGCVAAVASASSFKAESYPAAISGTQFEGKHLFKTVANTLSCNQYTFSGELVSASSKLALTGTPSECSTAGVIVMTVVMNGCTFDFGSGKELGAGEFAGTFAIACPAGKEIVWSATNGCTAKIPPQSVTANVTLENEAGAPSDWIRLTTEATGIEYTIEKGFFCAGAPSSGKYANGTYAGMTKLTAGNPEPIDLTVD